jgi:predicted nucleic acid-binding protein
MTRYLLDTDCVIDYLHGTPGTVALLQQLGREGHQFCTCGVVICESYTGLLPHDWLHGEELLEALLFLPASRLAARRAGIWRNDYRRQGIQLSATDCLIAATAHEHGAHVITANLRDFPMPEITILPLPRARV